MHDDLLQLQRVGRTGRQREGYVHVLLAKGREEMNWNKAREAYNDVQRSIVRGEQLELYGDVERLLPDYTKPECLEMVMEIEEYDRATTESSRENIVREPSKKRKRNSDLARDIPSGACTGFVRVAELLAKQKVKKRKKITKFDVDAGLDDDTDEEIEAGLFAPRRAASTSATSTKPPKTKLRRAKTTTDGGKKRQTTSKKTKARAGADSTELTLSQFSHKGIEDSDDIAIERGPWSTSLTTNPAPSPTRSSSPDVPLAQNQSIIDICTSAAPSRSSSPSPRYSTPSRSPGVVPPSQHTSPTSPKSPSTGPSGTVVAPEPYLGSVPPKKGASDQENAPNTGECETFVEDDSLAWLLADSDDAGEVTGSPARPRARKSGSQGSDAIEIEDSEVENESLVVLISSPVRTGGPHLPPPLPNRDMPPPAVPPPRPRLRSPSPVPPEPSLPVRAAGKAKKRSVIARAADSSSPLYPPRSQKRLRRRSSHDPSSSPYSSPPRPQKRKRPRLKVRDTAAAARAIPWIDVEAGHSGDEVSSGRTSPLGDEDDDEGEGEGVEGFVTDLPATQPSSSYDQSAVYRQSLLSQAPVKSKNKLSVPMFAAPPARRGGVRLGLVGPAGTTATATAMVGAASGSGDALNSSPPRYRYARSQFSSPAPSDEEDHYMLGSFVVDDEAEISFIQSSDP